jgi:hypothetical protein
MRRRPQHRVMMDRHFFVKRILVHPPPHASMKKTTHEIRMRVVVAVLVIRSIIITWRNFCSCNISNLPVGRTPHYRSSKGKDIYERPVEFLQRNLSPSRNQHELKDTIKAWLTTRTKRSAR